MLTIILLWLIGLFFLFLEFFLPGMILGTIGAILLIVSVVLFGLQVSTVAWLLLYFIAVCISVALLIKYTLRYIPKASPGFSIYLNQDQEGYQASKFDATAIGKTGIALTDLKPSGYILVEGKKLGALSQSGYITKDTPVVVLRGQEESLIVRRVNEVTENEK